MREACEEAARAIARCDDATATRMVLSALTRGFANSSLSIQSAMSELNYVHECTVGKMKECLIDNF